jgi:hypothetical protein
MHTIAGVLQGMVHMMFGGRELHKVHKYEYETNERTFQRDGHLLHVLSEFLFVYFNTFVHMPAAKPAKLSLIYGR